MRSGLRQAVALALAATCLAAQALAAGAVVKLDTATQRRLGIQTAPLAESAGVLGANGFARALDVTPLATLDADIAAAASALRASRAEAARAGTLAAADATVSRKAAEAAASQARADAAKLQLLRRRLGLEWSPALQAMSDSRRSRLLDRFAAGRAALVRIDVPGSGAAGAGPARLDLGPHGFVQAAILGPARTGDTRLQTTGLLALVTGPQARWLGAGVVVPAALAPGAASQAGVIIPREAVMRSGGETFAYVRRDATSFERRPVRDPRPEARGLFVQDGFRPGEPVVTAGAAKIYAASAPARSGD